MTVSYQYDVASSSTGGFFRLLWRWRGSIWKLLYKELLLFLGVYISIAFFYDFIIPDEYKKYYERSVIFCSAFVEIIPLSFILGFYVSFTAHRWWQQYTAIPWPDKLMNIIALYIPGNDVTSRVLRRTLMRYLNLTLVLVLRSISIPVKRRFPTKEHLVEAGFMSKPELEMYSSVPSHEFNTFWIPCTWFVNLLREAKSECRITDSGGLKLIMEEFNDFRSKCGLLWSYDWVSIPLVYTQVVTLSTQAFFLASLLGRQHINPKEHGIKNHKYGEYYIPVFTVLQFILYMGLLKLGEQLINPFGDDDEDFELNWIIDRHLKVSFLGVDILNSDPPPLIKDNYFDDRDIKLPYTEAAVAHKVKTYRGSVATFHVPTEKHGLVIPEFEDENEEDTDDEPSTIQSNRDATMRTSSWSLFGKKRKLSSSLDSFNSETMVETGLGENELPNIVPNSSWSNFLTAEAELKHQHAQVDSRIKLGVWPGEKVTEDTQGIRGVSNSEKQLCPPGQDPSSQTETLREPETSQGHMRAPGNNTELVKQSSFSTSDSSIIIPLSDDSDRRSSTNSASKFSGFRKYPLQVFSKEFANAPINIFSEFPDPSAKSISDKTSVSSLSLMGERRVPRHYKSLIKCHRAINPKLRIRPFRSKVTFSDDTKAGDNSRIPKSTLFTVPKWDSSSDSMPNVIKHYDEGLSLKMTSPVSTSIPFIQNLNVPFNENTKRRQSLDPNLYLAKTEEVTRDNWLHYQSLPNIQEEELPLSPTETVCSSDHITTNMDKANVPSQTCKEPKVPVPNLLSPQSSTDKPSHIVPSRRRSIKRQKSQDVGDEDLKIVKIPPPEQVKKQSSDESQTSSVTDNSSCSNHQKGSNTFVPTGILRRRKEDLKPRQASTESDTGSYHTVNSFLMQIEKSNSSSIDSFTSANSETNISSLALKDNSNRNESDKMAHSNRLKAPYPKMETSLVPKIIFSQSTPSVTSQSSDDQSSPKWDEKYGEFSSMETVKEAPFPMPKGSQPKHLGLNLRVVPTVPVRSACDSLHLNITDEAQSDTGDHQTRPSSAGDDCSLESTAKPNNHSTINKSSTLDIPR